MENRYINDSTRKGTFVQVLSKLKMIFNFSFIIIGKKNVVKLKITLLFF